MDSTTQRTRIRAQIRAFPRQATYPTGWNGEMTFAEIREALLPSMNRLMRYYRYVEVDIPDMIAHGFMRLWEALSAEPDLLAGRDQSGAVKWVMYRSGSSHYKKFYRREMYLEDLATRTGDPDEFIIDGYEGQFYLGHARYARAIEQRIDIEQAVTSLAEKYMHSLPHLAALYYITTDVKPDDAAGLAGRDGTKQSWWLTSIVKPMREELGELLGIYRPEKVTWQDKVAAGNADPLNELIESYQAKGDQRMVATLHNLSQQGSCASLMQQLDIPKTHVFYLRRKAHQALNDSYGCRP